MPALPLTANPFDAFDRQPLGALRGGLENPFDAFDAPEPARPATLEAVPSTPEPSLAVSTLKGLPRGAIETAATGLEPYALSRRLAQGRLRSLTDRTRGAADLSTGDFGKLLLEVSRSEIPMNVKGQIINAAKDIRAGRITPEAMPDFAAGIEGNPPETAARAMRSFAERTFPIPPEHEGRLPVQIGRGVGSTATFLGSRLLPGGQALLPVTAGSIGAGEAIQRAIENGAADERAAKAGFMGVIPGLTDVVPIERLLKPVAHIPGMKGALYAMGRKAVEQGLIEGTQEAAQQFMQNVIAKVTSKPDQEIAEGIKENGLVGFLVGALFGTGAGAVQTARQRKAAQAKANPFDRFDAQPAPPPSGQAPAPPSQTEAGEFAVTPRGRKVGVRYEVVEAAGLIPSHGPDLTPNPAYPAELQPRDRARAASAEQVNEIAARLEPSLLGRATSASEGAPIIGPDGAVESGNARVLGLQRAYGQGLPGADRYRDWLAGQGFDITGMTAPVLVRRRSTQLSPEDRAAFAREANERTTATMSASEQAAADAKAIPDNLMQLYKGGDIMGAGNRDFVRGFLETAVPTSERGALYTREGGLSQEGRRRIENALFSKAYEDTRLLADLREDPDNNFRAIGGAMTDVAGLWSAMRSDAAQGRIPPEIDATPALREAVAAVRRARSGKNTVADIARQGDLVSGGVSPEAMGFLRLMFRDEKFTRPASRERLAGSLRFYAEQARKAQAGPSLFPGQSAVRAADILELARQRSEGGLFDQLPGAAEMSLDHANMITAEARKRGIETKGRSLQAVADDLGEVFRPRTQETPPAIVPRRGPSITPTTARVEIYDQGGTVLTLPTERPLEQARALAENVAKARGSGTGWRYVDNETGRVLHDTGTVTIFDQFDALPETAEARGGVRGSAGAGVNYTPFVQDQVAGTAAEPGEVFRREDILRPLLKALNVPLYQGRMKQRKILGFYRRGIEEARIKRMSDIEVAAHELAHLLDDRIPEIRKQWFPASKANKPIRDELRGVSYDKSKLYEGFAEFVRLWATQKNHAQAKAPKFFAWFEDFVARSEYGPALRKAQEDMHRWFEQDAASRARSKIGVTEDINAGLTSVWDRWRQGIVDDLHGILIMEKDLTGKISKVGAYETARLTRAKHSMIEGTMLYGVPVVAEDGSHRFEGKGLKDILDPVADRIDDALLYFVGRSASELLGQGRERLFTPAEIKGMLALETPAFKKAFDEYQVWNKGILDFAQAKGVINPVARSYWKRAAYLPFHRVGQPGAFSPVPGDWKGIKALTGGTDNLRDVLGNMIGNTAMLMDAALTNEARQEVAKLAKLRGGARFMAEIPTEERTVKVHREEVKRRILEALGVKYANQLDVDTQILIDKIMDGMDGLVPFTLRGQTPLGGNVVAVLWGGKPTYYEVADPLLFRSLTHLNQPTKNWLVRALSVPRRLGQASITLAFDFMAANFARDTLMGTVMSRHGFKFLIDSARGLKSRITTDQNYRDFIANGGGFASYLVDEGAFRTHLEKFYTRKGIDYKTVLDTPGKLLFGLERLAESIEMSTRLGEFRKAIGKGEHPRHAAYSAREVSTDFAMRGDWAPLGFMYDTAMFLKAGMNGVDRFYRGIVYDENRMQIAAKTAIIAVVSMGIYALNRDNPMYDDLEDWDKDTHWHFFVPTGETIAAWAEGREVPPLEQRYHHFRYPKIWEIGAIASIAERALEGFLNGQPAEVAKHAADILRHTFNFEYLPQAIAPLAEQAMNRLRFFDRPIETQAQKEMLPFARSGPYTSPTVRAIGEATRGLPPDVQISPARLEALLRGYLNTWAMYGLSLSDALFFDEKADLRIDQYPVIRRFFQQHPAKSSRHVTELFDAIEAATEARRTMRFMDRTYRPDMATELENTPANLEFNQLNRADLNMRAIRKEIEQVIRAPSLPFVQDLTHQRERLPGNAALVARAKATGVWNDLGALKRFLMDDLVRERNVFAKDVMTDIRAQRRGTAGR